jgi:hypothetical protein
MFKKHGLLLSLIAIMALLLGTLLYVLDRPPAQTYLLPLFLSFSAGSEPFFGQIGNYLPGFVHVYAFTWLTVAVADSCLLSICLLWFSLDSLLEFAQALPFGLMAYQFLRIALNISRPVVSIGSISYPLP